MILPNKHISTRFSYVGLGAIVLQHLDRPRTVTALWDAVRERAEIATFERFSLALDFLFMIGAILFKDDFVRKAHA